jgi:hypothetical protein
MLIGHWHKLSLICPCCLVQCIRADWSDAVVAVDDWFCRSCQKPVFTPEDAAGRGTEYQPQHHEWER